MDDLGNMPPAQAEVIRGSVPITPGSKPDLYLRSRGIVLSPRVTTDLRMDKDQNMLALIRDRDGAIVSYQRTFLAQREDGGWDKERKQAKGIKIPHGSAVRLYDVGERDTVMGVAESTETAISAAKLHRVSTWSVLSAFQMQRWLPPPGVERLLIFADRDRSLVGERAAENLSRRVEMCFIQAAIHAPKLQEGCAGDWNDFLNEPVRERCR